MKTMTCKDLGGACDTQFQAETFEKMGEISKEHGMEMFKKGDKKHISAMEKIRDLMNNPYDMNEFMRIKEEMFDNKAED
jgi:hypothetical protein